MAKETRWEDVRLLSFDLQTVEFAYALVSAMDPLAVECLNLQYT